MDNNVYEQEIDLKDLMFAILHKWRPIILMAIVLAILLGGYKFGGGLIKQQNEEYVAEAEESFTEEKNTYTKTKTSLEREITNITANLESQEIYVENSILMKINPYDKWVASADIFVKMIEPQELQGITFSSVDFADSVVKAYASSIQKGNSLASLSKKKDIDLNYLKELVSVGTDYSSNMISVTTTYTDKKGAQEILYAILSSLESMYPEVKTQLGDHVISVMNENIGSITDSDLANRQTNNTNNVTSLQTSLEEKQKALEELEEPIAPVALSKSALLKSGIKYAFIGGALGMFITIFWVCVVFLMSGKVNSASELKSRFGVKILGVFTHPTEKRAFSGIDNWLDRLDGKEIWPEESVFDMITVNIKNYLEGNRTLLLTGTVDSGRLENIAKELKIRLPELEIEIGADMNHSAETLQMLPQYDAIVLLEECGKSKYSAIQQEIETLYNVKKSIIGCIVC